MSRHWRAPQPEREPLRPREVLALSVFAIGGAFLVLAGIGAIAGDPTPLQQVLQCFRGGA